MKMIGISRSTEFSPNMVGADAAIFQAVATSLEAQGHEVCLMDDAAWKAHSVDVARQLPDRVFTMSRNPATCYSLALLNKACGLHAVNTGAGLYVCAHRERTAQALTRAAVPQPPTCFITREADVPQAGYPAWMKRADGYSQEQTDVIYVNNATEARLAYRLFVAHGHTYVCFSQHVEGDLVKFYGVGQTGFFDWGYASEGHSKFGWEDVNGQPQGYPFDVELLRQASDAASRAVGVPVYGGDCVVRADGTFCIIDFNDWPSFSRCRERAAGAIAQRICMDMADTQRQAGAEQ